MRGAIEMHWVMNLLEWCSFHLMWVGGNHLKLKQKFENKNCGGRLVLSLYSGNLSSNPVEVFFL